MSATFLSVADLRWSTPDGRPVLDGVTIDFAAERTGLVGRNGVGKSTLLKLLAGTLAPTGGRVMRSGTVHLLRQIVQVAPEETIADLLGVRKAWAILQRADAGTATLEELGGADWTLEARASQALADVGLNASLGTLLARLSGGQRTRAALAAAMFAQPDFLLLDEPTNDLDRDGRGATSELLARWNGGAIVASHDRVLLTAMDTVVELTSLGARRYGGNWDDYSAQKAVELAAARQDLATAERQLTEIARKAQQAVERKQRRDAAGSRKGARGDMPKILAGARRERAEKSSGDNARLADRQRAAASETLASARTQVERITPLAVEIAPTGLSTAQRVLDVENVRFGYQPESPLLDRISLHLTGPERVAITGPNGSGKSTLLAILTATLTPWSGRATIHVAHTMLDQRVSLLDPAQSIAENFLRLNPGVDENGVRAAIARFGFRAEMGDRIVATLSGGQTLRAGLACVLSGPHPPQLLILDEPTNHLDMESIAALEAGLRAYDGALLVVSHDIAFLEAVELTRSVDLRARSNVQTS